MAGLASSWLVAANDATIRAELEAVYARVAEETRKRRPLCVASGRCCNFEAFGHRLYVTGLEAAHTIASLGEWSDRSRRESPMDATSEPSTRPEDDRRARPLPPSSLALPQIDEARARGDCPFLVDKLCSVHGIKPLGCRVYFCDPTAQIWQQELSEESLAAIRAIHERHGIEYRYGEWREMLDAVVFASAPG